MNNNVDGVKRTLLPTSYHLGKNITKNCRKSIHNAIKFKRTGLIRCRDFKGVTRYYVFRKLDASDSRT